MGTEHTELYISEKDLKAVIHLLPSIYSEPLADPACLPAYLISKLAKTKVTVTLSGDGGDELFCGYGLYRRLERIWTKYKKLPFAPRNACGLLLQHSPLKYGSKFYNMGEYARVPDSHRLHELFRNEHNLDAHSLVPRTANPRDYLCGTWLTEDKALLPDMAQYRNDLYLDTKEIKSAMLYRDQNGFLTDTVLPKVDRAGMFVSLENRIPLLDKDIIEFSWTLPISYKSSDGIDKKILKELLYEYVPKEMLDRPKHGFEVPLPAWLSTGELHEWASDLIMHSRLADDGYFDKKILNRIWNRFNRDKSNTLLLWYVLQAESWYRQQLHV